MILSLSLLQEGLQGKWSLFDPHNTTTQWNRLAWRLWFCTLNGISTRAGESSPIIHFLPLEGSGIVFGQFNQSSHLEEHIFESLEFSPEFSRLAKLLLTLLLKSAVLLPLYHKTHTHTHPDTLLMWYINQNSDFFFKQLTTHHRGS